MKARSIGNSCSNGTRRIARYVRAVALGIALPLALGAAATSAQAAYPDKQLTIIVAWPAGGATDLTSRVIQDTFAKTLGTTSIIKNVVGAAGTIGTTEAANAAPDGYTLLITPIGPMVIQPQRLKLSYSPASFEPVCKVVDVTVVMMSPPQSRFKTVADVIREAKAQDGKLPYASSGAGTIPHMAKIALQQAAKVSMKHVPFKGSGEVVQAMLAGTVELYSDQPNLVGRYNMNAIAVFSKNRLPEFKDTPTMKEAGYDLEFSIWSAMFAPKGTPEPVLAKLEAACRETMASPAVVEGLGKQAQPIHFLDRKATRAFVDAEFTKAKGLIEAAGLAPK